MVGFTQGRRSHLADKFGDAANLAAAALVFGQAVSQQAFSIPLALAGFLIWLMFMVVSFFLRGESR
jgi:hypothetical protein